MQFVFSRAFGRLFLALACAAAFVAFAAGTASAATKPTVPPAGEISNVTPRTDYTGSVEGNVGAQEQCDDPLATGICADFIFEVVNPGQAEATIRWDRPAIVALENDLDLYILRCTDPFEVDPLGNPVQLVENRTCQQVVAAANPNPAPELIDPLQTFFEERAEFFAESTVDTNVEQIFYVARTVPFTVVTGAQPYTGCVAYDGFCDPAPAEVPPPAPTPTDEAQCNAPEDDPNAEYRITGGGKLGLPEPNTGATQTSENERPQFAVNAEQEKDDGVFEEDGKVDYRDKNFNGLRLKGKVRKAHFQQDGYSEDGKPTGYADLCGEGEVRDENAKTKDEDEQKKRKVCFYARPDDNGKNRHDGERDTFRIKIWERGPDGKCDFSTTPMYDSGKRPVKDGQIVFHKRQDNNKDD